MRVRLEAGKELSPEETAWLAEYTAARAADPNPEPEIEGAEGAEPEGEPEPAPPIVEAAPPLVPPAPKVRPPPAPKLPSPPRVERPREEPRAETRGGNGSDDSSWKKKFVNAHEQGGGGREQAVTEIASAWIMVLEKMAAECELAGVDPVIDPKALAASIVLTVDKILPSNIRLTAEMKAAGGSTAILGQRFWHRKKIGEAIKIRDARDATASKLDEIKANTVKESIARERASSPPPPSPSSPLVPPEATNGAHVNAIFSPQVAELEIPYDPSDPDRLI